MNLKTHEWIAVAAALIIVGGFFLVFNQNTSVDLSAGAEENNTATAINNLAGAIQGDLTELIMEDLVEGEGEGAIRGDRLSVHYVGILPDGTQFDNSIARGAPFEFTLGAGAVIEGWDEGLVGMKVGGRRVLVIPPEKGYGERGTGGIPPNSTLIFEVLLLEIK